MEYRFITHPFAPVYDTDSQILILGTLPSVKSRENDFFYGHPQNRFWKVIAGLCGAPVPRTVEQKRELLLANRIALWDVIGSCEIRGSSDSSIRNVVPADLSRILDAAPIRKIFTNGSKASQLYRRYQLPLTQIPDIPLPSTSPANAAWSLDALCSAWRVIGEQNP